MDAATDAIKENGKTAIEHGSALDIDSEAGRRNMEALMGIASAYLSLAEEQMKNGASAAEMADSQARAVGAFIASAEAAGLTREAAAKLAAQFGMIPDDVATQISTPGADLSRQQIEDVTRAAKLVPGLTEAEVLAPGARPSKAEVDALVKSVGNVPGLTEAQIRTIANLYGVEVAKRELASVKDKTVTVRTVYRSVGSPMPAVADGGMFANTGAGLVQAFASGGMHTPRYVGNFRQPGFYPYAGKGGVIMNEEGSGPWELIVSGNPAKRRRSRWLLEEGARRLGGAVSWATAYADGGIHAPRYGSNYSPPASLMPTSSPAASGRDLLTATEMSQIARYMVSEFAAVVREPSVGVRPSVPLGGR